MTYAPGDLLNVRGYLIRTLDLVPGVARGVDLEAAEVGIVGDPAHAATGGYHEGNDDLARVGRLSTDYSKRESARDRPGTNAASALDIGYFDVTMPSGRRVTLRSMSAAIVAACERNDPRTEAIREVVWSPDGSVVRRWDRLGVRSTGDDSHRTHTHLSFFRDSEGRRDRSDNLFGLLSEIIEGTSGMELSDTITGTGSAGNPSDRTVNHVLGDEYRTIQGSARRMGVDGRYDLGGLWPESPITELVLGVRELIDRPPAALTDEQAAAMAGQVLAALPGIVDASVEAALARTRLAVDPAPAG